MDSGVLQDLLNAAKVKTTQIVNNEIPKALNQLKSIYLSKYFSSDTISVFIFGKHFFKPDCPEEYFRAVLLGM